LTNEIRGLGLNMQLEKKRVWRRLVDRREGRPGRPARPSRPV